MLIQRFSRSGTELPEKEVTEESFIVFSGEKTPRKKPFSCSVFIQFSSGYGGGWIKTDTQTHANVVDKQTTNDGLVRAEEDAGTRDEGSCWLPGPGGVDSASLVWRALTAELSAALLMT